MALGGRYKIPLRSASLSLLARVIGGSHVENVPFSGRRLDHLSDERVLLTLWLLQLLEPIELLFYPAIHKLLL